MPDKEIIKDEKIIIQYKNEKDVKSFQEIMKILFKSYIIKAMQNKKDK